MALHVASILVALTTSTATMAAALPAVMGRVGRPARLAQIGVVLQALGWALVLASGATAPGSVLDRVLSTLSIAGISGGLAANAQAFDLWCGAAVARRAPWVIAVLVTVGYALGFSSYSFRFAWANGLLAVQMGFVAAMLAQPTGAPVGRWRWLLFVALLAQMVMTTWRGLLGAFFSPSLPSFAADHPVNIAFALVANATSVLGMIGVLLAHRDEAARELVRLANFDGLTHVLNRHAWMAQATTALGVGARYGHPVALLMIDIDHFKRVNDAHGHEAGDRALQFIARSLQAAVRTGDLVGRYGGEEFCVLLNHADDGAPGAFDRRLRSLLRADSAIPELGFPVSFSAGVAQRSGSDDSLQTMLRRADKMLYRAKGEGRGRTLDAEGRALLAA